MTADADSAKASVLCEVDKRDPFGKEQVMCAARGWIFLPDFAVGLTRR